MEFGLFAMPEHYPWENWTLAYDRDLATIVRAEQLGFESIGTGEHVVLVKADSPYKTLGDLVTAMKGNPADGSLRWYELLWSPAIDRTELWESGGRTISTAGQWWPDGSTMENPPPWVMALGIDDNSGALEGDFGCPGSDGELEVG